MPTRTWRRFVPEASWGAAGIDNRNAAVTARAAANVARVPLRGHAVPGMPRQTRASGAGWLGFSNIAESMSEFSAGVKPTNDIHAGSRGAANGPVPRAAAGVEDNQPQSEAVSSKFVWSGYISLQLGVSQYSSPIQEQGLATPQVHGVYSPYSHANWTAVVLPQS